MDVAIKKVGSSSIILGSFYYSGFISEKSNKLLKITKKDDRHDEFKYLNRIREITKYDKYFSIPEETEYILQPSDFFYEYLQKLVKQDKSTIFGGVLYCYYIPWAGNKDLHDTIVELGRMRKSSIWKSSKSILQFSKEILIAIGYLHEKKICHLDIKPENIVITRCNDFKIIDFGYSSLEPFNDYVEQIRGTPEYFPMNIPTIKPTRLLPKIEATDAILVNGQMPMMKNRKLVYKIDSYCLGRTLNMLFTVFMDNYIIPCFSCETSTLKTIHKIIRELLENDVYRRPTILECVETYC
jgi:serine/threonine protein kinase